MIISKEKQAKLKVIASKMSKMGFGDTNSLNQELITRYLEIEVKKLQLS